MIAIAEKYGPLTREDIYQYIPHREPFLFVDEITEIIPGRDEEGNFQPKDTVVLQIRPNAFSQKGILTGFIYLGNVVGAGTPPQ